MTYLQVFRVLNTILLFINIFLYIFTDNSLYQYFIIITGLFLYVPFVLYNLYIRFLGTFFNKNIDFSVFKRP
jgi:hypothetical protein